MRRTCGLWIILAAVLTSAIPAYCESEAERHLRDEYRGKTFVLRGFYSGDHLQYDSAGAPKGNVTVGDWTSDGIIFVKGLYVWHGHLTIEAERQLVIHFEEREFQFLPESEDDKRKLKIEADLGPTNLTPGQADAAMEKLFITAHEELVNLVPDYWKPCLRNAGSGGKGICRFSSEFRLIPGLAAAPGSGETVAEGCPSQPRAGECAPIRGNLNGPNIIYAPSLAPSESAASAKLHAAARLKLVVDERGIPRNVHITKPIGYDLDEPALKCAQQNRFRPAEKDGQPVAVETEVDLGIQVN